MLVWRGRSSTPRVCSPRWSTCRTRPAWLMAQYQRTFDLLFEPPILPTSCPRRRPGAARRARRARGGRGAARGRQERTGAAAGRARSGGGWSARRSTPRSRRDADGDALWTAGARRLGAQMPAPAEISRRYVDVLTENLGQPGFREVLVAVHDLDCASRSDRRVARARRARPRSRRAATAPGPREAEVVDFDGASANWSWIFWPARCACRSPPRRTSMQFPADGYWRGELHQLCDRPELAVRLLEEMAAVGVEQVIVVSAAPPAAAPHGLRSRPARPPRPDRRASSGRSRRPRSTTRCARPRPNFAGVFVIRPVHNPIGPFDFGGVYDEASDRRRTCPN